MPGWHEATKQLQDEGKIRMLGIIQEQHPDRTRLFMQWKRMQWPILVDSLNLLGVELVPITVLIDEQGIVRAVKARQEDLDAFLQSGSPATDAVPAPAFRHDLQTLAQAARGGDASALRDYADALVMWAPTSRLGEAITLYKQALRQDTEQGPTHFRLGVAYRKRYDSEQREEGDFANAVRHWGRALEINPNQYIWRRRIQQYGPRLEKPYSFYDWVRQAREEIEQRGETPMPLSVEPGGAEFAYPLRSFESVQQTDRNPDPQGRIRRDPGLIRAEATVVPDKLSAGGSGRIHVVFRPDASQAAHWNNEVEDLVFWVDPPPGWQVDSRRQSVARPPQIASREAREVEFEVKPPQDFAGAASINGYALYYVCEDVDSTCLYRRQDVAVEVQVEDKK